MSVVIDGVEVVGVPETDDAAVNAVSAVELDIWEVKTGSELGSWAFQALAAYKR